MATEPENQSLRPRHLRVLKVLARAPPQGRDVNALLARGFRFETIADLAHSELATVQLESVKKRGRTVEIARVSITDAGRRVLEGQAEFD
jgi:hypothetical protein